MTIFKFLKRVVARMLHLRFRKSFLILCTLTVLSVSFLAHTRNFESVGAPKVEISGASAHWVEVGIVLWHPPEDTAEIALYANSDINSLFKPNVGDEYRGRITATPERLMSKYPHLAPYKAFSIDIDRQNARRLLRHGVYVVGYDATGTVLAATRVQIPGVLDELYTSNDDDADEARLGVVYEGKNVALSVWGPTAQNINVLVYEEDKRLIHRYPMVLDSKTGIWRFEGDESINRKFYQIEVTVVDPLSLQVKTIIATDPYAVSLSTNGEYAQFVNLEDDDLKPSGWDAHVIPVLKHPQDAVIYEGHIRDFSIGDETVSKQARGKYMAFTEFNSDGMRHLASLTDAGLTHFHVLPINDIASINERIEQQINGSTTLGALCPLQGNFDFLCNKLSHGLTLTEVLETFDPVSADAQAFLDEWRDLDGFNWGYDPQHFNAPEGSYSSKPDGVARIVELRAMNMALHRLGLRVVMDVVYNHSHASGFNSKSVFDKIVPGYYHRLDPISGHVEHSTCCENLAPEHRMMAKFMEESLVLWAKYYRFDGFRFDLMGHIPSEVILQARRSVQMVDPDTYFYGEGWNFGEVADDARFRQATQINLSGTNIGTYNDRFRDAIRGAELFLPQPNLKDMDVLRLGLAGTLSVFLFKDQNDVVKSGQDFTWRGQPAGYAKNPLDIINYVSKHDDETLWDKLQYALPEKMTKSHRLRVQNMALAMPLMAQGIPFLQLGGDLVRSKSMNRNTFDAGDWFNRIDFTKSTHNWKAGLPMAQDNQKQWPRITALFKNQEAQLNGDDIAHASEVFKEFLRIRASSRLFRLSSADDILNRVSFFNTGQQQVPGLIVMQIMDGTDLNDIDPAVDAIMLVINGSAYKRRFDVPTDKHFILHEVLRNSVDDVIKTSAFEQGVFSVPAYSLAVFVAPQAK